MQRVHPPGRELAGKIALQISMVKFYLDVPKKKNASNEQKWQLVIDYRKLNDIIISDAYPIPNVNEILNQLSNSKYISTLDLA